MILDDEQYRRLNHRMSILLALVFVAALLLGFFGRGWLFPCPPVAPALPPDTIRVYRDSANRQLAAENRRLTLELLDTRLLLDRYEKILYRISAATPPTPVDRTVPVDSVLRTIDEIIRRRPLPYRQHSAAGR